jgi:hypothetical protein
MKIAYIKLTSRKGIFLTIASYIVGEAIFIASPFLAYSPSDSFSGGHFVLQ